MTTYKVLIYSGNGVGQNCLPGMEEALDKANIQGYSFTHTRNTTINSKTLAGYHALFLPGGNSAKTLYLNNPNINVNDIKNWQKNGGIVVAVCSGAYISSSKVIDYYTAWGLAPNVISTSYPHEGTVSVSFTPDGSNFFGKTGNLSMAHYSGPAMKVSGTAKILAKYNGGPFAGYGAIVRDGRTVLFGPHPELDPKYPELIVKSIIKIKEEENMATTDISEKQTYLTKTQFIDMNTRVKLWFDSRNLSASDAYSGKITQHPPKVYVVRGAGPITDPLNGKVYPGAYITWARWVDMRTRYWAYYNSHNKTAPSKIYIVKPKVIPTPTVGPIQNKIQVGSGKKFSNFTEFYNIVKATCNYAYYFDNKKTLESEISHVIADIKGQDSGQNCCDWAQLGAALAREMGYTVVLHGIYCPTDQIYHAVFTIKGREFATETVIDLAAAASDNYPVGRHWCNDPTPKTANPAWLPYEKL